MSSFPVADSHYYGIDYKNRHSANDLSWYKHIPVPTSYMICQTAFNFLVATIMPPAVEFLHVANRHIAPGKKQWTWATIGSLSWIES